ncbi:MAG TPA: TIGR01777 family oxidoreductase [Bacteriovoracaceae bacterium]|nr:TIGR01777 family oxidoreductase [Bacteriovoracaceae bacterium]
MKVLITGGTGFVGRVIVRQLLESGDEVIVLTRNVAKAIMNLGKDCRYVQWNSTEVPPELDPALEVDGVINLMGEGIAEKRWSEEQKKKIYGSRIHGTGNLIKGLSTLQRRPSVFVSTSAVGIYGNRSDEEISEASPVGSDYLATVCKDWEKAAQGAAELGCRLAVIRVGVVLGKGGGALHKMLPIFKLGVGGKVGSGEQFMSWIHIEDLAAMYIEALKNPKITGVYNGTSLYPVTNLEFTKTLGKTIKRPTFAPAPAFALKAVFGEMSAVLLEGQKVIPKMFKETDFRYRYPTLELALRDAAL